jgi:hypothetical protein
MSKEEKDKIIKFIEEEKSRIMFGKLLIEITIRDNMIIFIQGETKRSVNLLQEVV